MDKKWETDSLPDLITINLCVFMCACVNVWVDEYESEWAQRVCNLYEIEYLYGIWSLDIYSPFIIHHSPIIIYNRI